MFLLRGRPGLGHVTPGLALAEYLQRTTRHEIVICTYDNGVKLLKRSGFKVVDLDLTGNYAVWSGMNVIDHFALKLTPVLKQFSPQLVIGGGEYLLPLMADCCPGMKFALIYNPEVFARSPHNETFRSIFFSIFSKSHYLICQAAPPPKKHLWKEAVPLVYGKSIYAGPLLRPETSTPQGDKPKKHFEVVVANGGGLNMPETTSTYSLKSNDSMLWKKQNCEFTEEAIVQLLKLGLKNLKVHVFLCLTPSEIALLKKKYGHHRCIKFYSFSLEYMQRLQTAQLVITRAGASSLGEIIALKKNAVLWPLTGHKEQERSVLFSEKKYKFVTGWWKKEQLSGIIQKKIKQAITGETVPESDPQKVLEKIADYLSVRR
jgi:hypothetical protein